MCKSFETGLATGYRRHLPLRGLLILALARSVVPLMNAADNPRPLLGTWTGKATGPQGGPPTGDITVVFERADGNELKGTILVKGQGGGEYSGTVSDIRLTKGQLTAAAVFKLGENPLEVRVAGPLKGKSIAGTFTVMVKEQAMGNGTFNITKVSSTRPKK